MGWVGAGTRSPALPNKLRTRSPMDTASDYGSEEWEFKSLRVRQKKVKLSCAFCLHTACIGARV